MRQPYGMLPDFNIFRIYKARDPADLSNRVSRSMGVYMGQV